MRFRTREYWHRDMILSTGRTVTLVWDEFTRIPACSEALIDAPIGIVRIQGALTSGEAWEIRERLNADPLLNRKDTQICECGHAYSGYHRTPGTECAAHECACMRFREAPPTP